MSLDSQTPATAPGLPTAEAPSVPRGSHVVRYYDDDVALIAIRSPDNKTIFAPDAGR